MSLNKMFSRLMGCFVVALLVGCGAEQPAGSSIGTQSAGQHVDPGTLSSDQEAHLREVSKELVQNALPGETSAEFAAESVLNRNSVGGYVVQGTLEQKNAEGEASSSEYLVSFDDMHGKMPRVVIIDRKLAWKAETLPPDAEELKLAEPVKPSTAEAN